MSNHNVSSLGWAFGGSAAAPQVTSANRYANGSNQNCGNVITDRSTTRIHAAPGGNSSLSLAFDPKPVAAKAAPTAAPAAAAAAPAAPATAAFGARTSANSANRYATGSNQNCGNVITDRSTTRIHAPPGGRSQISFGAGPEAPKAAPAKPAALQATTSHNAATAAPAAQKAAPAAGPVFGARSAANSANRYASGSNQNCGNVITDRSTTRIHAPPGGRSSITFG